MRRMYVSLGVVFEKPSSSGDRPIAILTLRTWAVWERDRRLTYFLPFLLFVTFTPEFVIGQIYLRRLTRK